MRLALHRLFENSLHLKMHAAAFAENFLQDLQKLLKTLFRYHILFDGQRHLIVRCESTFCLTQDAVKEDIIISDFR